MTALHDGRNPRNRSITPLPCFIFASSIDNLLFEINSGDCRAATAVVRRLARRLRRTRAPPEYHRLVVTRAVFWSAHTPRQLCALRTQDTRATEGACHCRVIPLSYPTSKRKVPCIADSPCSPMRLAWGERGDASNRVMLARHV
jgi:hypothetical protein